MEILILKSAACLAILMVFYKLFLEHLAIHKFKRFYLLGALLVSIVIPFITFIKYIDPVYDFGTFEADTFTTPPYFPANVAIEESTNYLPIILWSIYGLGALLFASKFCINLFGIVSKINKNEKQKHDNFISVLLNDLIVPHTFFSYIFLNKTKFETKAIPQEVILHEQTHASQKHSLDILFIELLQIVFWFNPLLYFIKKDIKLNHEFLADAAVLKQGIDSSTYQETLLQFTSNVNGIPLAHAINYSLIKKRFTIMKTQTSKKAIWLRSLLLIPLLGGLLFSFSSTKEVEKEVVPAMVFPEESQNNDALTDVKDELAKTKSLKINYTARSIDIKVFKNGTYKIDGIKANKNTFKQVINQFHQDVTKEIRNKIINVHVNSPEDISNKEVWFIYNSVLDYGFHRIVAYNQEVVRSKGNKPFAIENGNKEVSKKGNLTVNGIVCDGCSLNLSKKGVENIILGTTTGDQILSFKIKFPGYPTETIKGDALNAKAVSNLKNSSLGIALSLFDIKTVEKEKLAPIVITLVDKNDKNYSHSPVVKKGETSLLPPPPPPSKNKIIGSLSGFSKYMLQTEKNGDAILYNNKEITAKKAISLYKKFGKVDLIVKKIARGKYRVHLAEAQGDVSTMTTEDLSKNAPPPPPPPAPPKVKKGERSNIPPPPPPAPLVKDIKESKTGYKNINGESYFYSTGNGVTKYYNRFGYEVDKKGNKLSNTQTDGDKVIKGQKITKVYKDGKVVTKFKKTWEDDNTNIPPPPPPMSTLDYVVSMAKKGASFYYNEESISSDKAIEIAKKNDEINILSQSNNGKPTVQLSTEPLSISNGRAQVIKKRNKSLEARKKVLEGQKEARKEMLKDRKQALEERKRLMKEHKDKNQKPLAEQFKGMEKNGGEFFYEGEKITENKAIKLIKDNPKLNVSIHSENDKSTVNLSKKGIKIINGRLAKKTN
jgi:hypothetical protein